MANKTEKLAFEIGDTVAEELGMSLVDAQFKSEGGKKVLRLFVDKNGGTGIDDCEVFSRAFEEKFDELDPIENEYVLEVSSPGIDRKLSTEREFLHYIGKTVDVKLYKASDGKKEFTGVLKDYKNGEAGIEYGGEVFYTNTKEAAYIKLHFEF